MHKSLLLNGDITRDGEELALEDHVKNGQILHESSYIMLLIHGIVKFKKQALEMENQDMLKLFWP